MSLGRHSRCPVCETANHNPPLHRFTVEQAATHFCPPWRNAERHRRLVTCIRRLWGSDTAEVHKCGECGFGYAWPFVGGDEEFYGILHEQAGYPGWRWEYDQTVQRVLADMEGGAILDIGTGDGAFLKRLDKRWRTFATEGSEVTRSRLRADGIHCFGSTAEALASHAGQFQVITMFQVLEHIAAFDAMLRDCRALLRPGGRLVVAVPDGDVGMVQERLTGCMDMTPNHCNKWTARSLSMAIAKAGFEPEPAVHEPPSWSKFRYRAWLRVLARASGKPGSLTARIYGLRQRRLRLAILAVLAAASALRCLPRWREFAQGESLLVVGRRPGGG